MKKEFLHPHSSFSKKKVRETNPPFLALQRKFCVQTYTARFLTPRILKYNRNFDLFMIGRILELAYYTPVFVLRSVCQVRKESEVLWSAQLKVPLEGKSCGNLVVTLVEHTQGLPHASGSQESSFVYTFHKIFLGCKFDENQSINSCKLRRICRNGAKLSLECCSKLEFFFWKLWCDPCSFFMGFAKVFQNAQWIFLGVNQNTQFVHRDAILYLLLRAPQTPATPLIILSPSRLTYCISIFFFITKTANTFNLYMLPCMRVWTCITHACIRHTIMSSHNKYETTICGNCTNDDCT